MAKTTVNVLQSGKGKPSVSKIAKNTPKVRKQMDNFNSKKKGA